MWSGQASKQFLTSKRIKVIFLLTSDLNRHLSHTGSKLPLVSAAPCWPWCAAVLGSVWLTKTGVWECDVHDLVQVHRSSVLFWGHVACSCCNDTNAWYACLPQVIVGILLVCCLFSFELKLSNLSLWGWNCTVQPWSYYTSYVLSQGIAEPDPRDIHGLTYTRGSSAPTPLFHASRD